MINNFHHIPVLLQEVIEALKVEEGKAYIDATLGGGGHTKEILKQGGAVLGIDQDEDAIGFVNGSKVSEISNKKLIAVKGNFSEIGLIARENGFENVDGVLLDLGVSSYQLDVSGRGFSIKQDERLDMRMNKDGALSAYEVVNSYPFERLVDIFYRYGEEHNAKEIAQAIIDKRKKEDIKTTQELARLVERVPHKNEDIHPATRVFQAVRIEVNNELEVLRMALQEGAQLLRPSGRLVVISFHSLEDRIVKQAYERMKREGMGAVVTKKPIVASQQEQKINRRSRSAKMRIFEKN